MFSTFCSKTPSKKAKAELGKKLLEARHAAGLSLEEAACKAALHEDCIRALELDLSETNTNAFALGDPSYRRFIALRYAHVLGLSADMIRSELPPLASLDPPDSTFLKNWNQARTPSGSCWARPSASLYFSPRLVVSLKRVLLLVVVLVTAFYSWNILRHFYRVVRKKTPPEIERSSFF